MYSYKELMLYTGLVMEGLGVLIILGGALYSSWRFSANTQPGGQRSYRVYRQDLGRAVLLGLEFLIAGDIIRTVAVDLTLESVAILGGIVLIRTFLSIALHVEVEGCWPWQLKRESREYPGEAPEPTKTMDKKEMPDE